MDSLVTIEKKIENFFFFLSCRSNYFFNFESITKVWRNVRCKKSYHLEADQLFLQKNKDLFNLIFLIYIKHPVILESSTLIKYMAPFPV